MCFESMSTQEGHSGENRLDHTGHGVSVSIE
jgi:hypothetical protein